MARVDVPGSAPARLTWRPPAVVPQDPAGLARLVQEQLQAIFAELQRVAERRNVVPLAGDTEARAGQVLMGVANGQKILLPQAATGEFAEITFIITDVVSAATLVNPDGTPLLLDRPGTYEVALGQQDTAWRGPPSLSSSGSADTWATALAAGNTSGGTDPTISAGDTLEFETGGVVNAADTLTVSTGSDLSLQASGDASVFGADTFVSAASALRFFTNATDRLRIDSAGAWLLAGDGGASGEVLSSAGAGSPPVWADPDTLVTPYTAGDGIDLAAFVFSADVSDFAGTGIEDDGANNLRIAAAAAGAGLTGGGGSALAVGAGTGITVNANDVAWNGVDVRKNSTGSVFTRRRLNLIEGTNVTLTVADDAGNGEVDVTIASSGGGGVGDADYGDITVSSSGTVWTVDGDIAKTWTGNHNFNNRIRWSNINAQTFAATATDFALGGVNVLRVSLTGNQSLTGMVPAVDDQLCIIENADATELLTLVHDATSSANNRFQLPGLKNLVMPPKSMALARYDATSSKWYVCGPAGTDTCLLAVHRLESADASITITPPAGATWFEIEGVAGGGGGGGADAETNGEVCAGGGGGSGGWFRDIVPIVSGNITGQVGAAGTAGSNTGGNGGTGGTTSYTYNSATRTALGGGGGTGTAAGTAAANQRLTTAGGAGGVPDVADESSVGGDGTDGIMFAAATFTTLYTGAMARGGTGGASRYGGGGKGGSVAAAAGAANGNSGKAPGSGGGGAARIVAATGAATGATGGIGNTGAMYVRFYSGPVPSEAAIS